MAEVIVTSMNFEEEVVNSTVPVLVDFWAPWCGPCQMLGPVLKELAEEYEGKIKVGKINCDEETSLAIRNGISSIPAVMLYKNGKIKDAFVGYQPIEKVKAFIDKNL